MLKQLSVFLALLSGFILLFSCSAQKKVKRAGTGEIHDQYQVDQKAGFEGGKRQLFQILSSNLEYPEEAILKNIQGRVIVKFVVENNGTINNFEILKDIGAGCADEIIRVLQKTQARWNPAKINRKRVRSYYILSVNFRIPSDDSQPYIQDETN
ncbi:MAG: energy transducer TonB [Flavobacteriaceae bacterium]|jgi:TonB family protein|nr:energy transducer TonB [Flavobacteriaceae bacterium]